MFWEPIKNRVSPRSVLLKAVYLEALLYLTVHFLYVTLLSCTFYYIVRRSAKSCQWDFSCSFNLAVVDLDDAPTPSWLKRRKMESFLATDNQLTRAFVNSTKTRSAVRRSRRDTAAAAAPP